MAPRSRALALLGASHPGPGLAVTLLAGAYAVSAGLPAGGVALVVAAVGTGQLSVGWSNDAIDAHRDRTVGRDDKPIVGGAVSERVVRAAAGVALAATVVLSLLASLPGGAIHLLGVALAWGYNLGLKATAWSWAPYAIAFGGLPAFITLSGPDAALPPWWIIAAAALLGVGAHLLNTLPDLADDERTGVRGLPHRLGHRAAAAVAALSLLVASVLMALSASGVADVVRVLVLLVAAALAALALVARGRNAFRAGVGIAVVDVLLLVSAR